VGVLVGVRVGLGVMEGGGVRLGEAVAVGEVVGEGCSVNVLVGVELAWRVCRLVACVQAESSKARTNPREKITDLMAQ